MRIITKRPDDMSFEDYKTFLKIQNKVLRHYKKGKVVHLAKLYPTERVLAELAKMGDTELLRLIQEGRTFTGNVKDL